MLNNHTQILGLGDTLPPRLLGCGCGCGEPLDTCPFWQEVESRLTYIGKRTLVPAVPTQLLPKGADGPVWRTELREPNRATSAIEHLTIPLFMSVIKLGSHVPLKRFAASYDRFLSVCSLHFDYRIFLDGYKSIKHYLALKACGMPVSGVIHLVRDPRAYVASAKRAGYSLKQATSEWGRLHWSIEKILDGVGEKVLLLRYEDFCAQPGESLGMIQNWMRLPPESILGRPSAELHWVGNASMLQFTGDVRPSDRWHRELSSHDLEYLAAHWPRSALRYNYDI